VTRVSRSLTRGRIAPFALAGDFDDDKQVVILNNDVTRRSALSGLVGAAVVPHAQAAELAATTAVAASNFHGLAQHGTIAAAIAAGEAATQIGGLFCVDDGVGNLLFRERTTGGSLEVARSVTPTVLASADAGSKLVAFIQDGDGAVGRTVEAKNRDRVTTTDFSSIQTALDYGTAQRTSVRLPRGSYATTGLVFRGPRLEGDGAVVTRASGKAPLITIPDDDAGLQTGRSTVLRDLWIDSAIDGKPAGTGLLIENSAVAKIENVTVTGAAIGIDVHQAQFIPLNHIAAKFCDVGAVIRGSKAAGGGNSLTLNHPVFVNTKVGLIIDGTSSGFGMGDIVLVNPQTLVCTVCALAVFGLSDKARTSCITILGAGPEANADTSAPASFAYNGLKIPKCAYYFHYADVHLSGVSIAEYSSVNPAIILKGSSLLLTNCHGYSNPQGVVVQADAQSSVSIQGQYGLNGTVHQVVSFSGHLSTVAPFGALIGPRRETIVHTIPNVMVQPDIANVREALGTSHSIETDSRGRFVRVRFASKVGAPDSHCIRLDTHERPADRWVYRFEIKSDIDTRIRLSFYPDEQPRIINLMAGQPTLAVVFANAVINRAGLIVIQPLAADGAQIEVRNGHAIFGSRDNSQFRADCNALCAGAYNPRIAALVPYTAQPQRPTSASYPVGARVKNTVPAPGRPTGWVHAGEGRWLIEGIYRAPE
jgi:hypothetical protein